MFCSCVGIQECEASLIDDYHCPNCGRSHDQLQCKWYSYGQVHQVLLIRWLTPPASQLWWLSGGLDEKHHNCSMLCCVRQLCTTICTHTCEQFLNLHFGLGLDFVFVHLFRVNFFLCFYVSWDHSIFVLLAFVVGFSFFVAKPIDCLGRKSPKWPILCWLGHKTKCRVGHE